MIFNTFYRKKCLEYTKYKTDKAVYKGLAELVKAEIIARGPAGPGRRAFLN